MEKIKKLIIRIALRWFKEEMRKNPAMSYRELGHYGVQDIVKLSSTGENAFVL